MPLLKDGRLADDRWTYTIDDQPLGDGPVFISLARWTAQRTTLRARNAPLGLVLAPDEGVEDVAKDLERFDAIALGFPTFKDGRSYSTARILRERYGYEGELRAVGDINRDQFVFLVRAGFDALEVSGEAGSTDADAFDAALTRFGGYYQPASDRPPPARPETPSPAAAWAY